MGAQLVNNPIFKSCIKQSILHDLLLNYINILREKELNTIAMEEKESYTI